MDDIKLYCCDCGAELHTILHIEPTDSYGKSLVLETSLLGTAAWISTRFFRCGTCFIAKQQERKSHERPRKDANQ